MMAARLVLAAVALTGILCGAFTLYLFLFQSSLVFLPDHGREIRATPDQAGLAWEAVTLRTADGLALEAWHVPPAGGGNGVARGTMLMLHGNAGNISHRIEYARMFSSLGWATLLASYRGYARNPGTPSEEGLYLDAQAAWDWLTATRRVPPAQIVIVGESLGGGPASWLAARTEPAALILISSFTSIPDLAQELYPWLPVRPLARIRFDNVANVGKLRAPLLVVHGRRDTLVGFWHAERLVGAAGGRGRLLALDGDHNDLLAESARLRDGMAAFIDRYVSGKAVAK